MAAIRSLLNPVLERNNDESRTTPTYLPSPSASDHMRDYSPTPSQPIRKKQKISKDQAVFTRGPIRGECRYPPHEYQDEMLAAYHQQFEVYPMGEIAEYPRHIPYNSEKKTFLGKTGREYFEGKDACCYTSLPLTVASFPIPFQGSK